MAARDTERIQSNNGSASLGNLENSMAGIPTYIQPGNF